MSWLIRKLLNNALSYVEVKKMQNEWPKPSKLYRRNLVLQQKLLGIFTSACIFEIEGPYSDNRSLSLTDLYSFACVCCRMRGIFVTF